MDAIPFMVIAEAGTMESMRIHYETSLATMVQFIVGTILTFVGTIGSIISGCRSGTDCIGNTFVSLLLLVFVVIGYVFLLALGYVAQERRSSRLALLLIACETFAAIIFLFDARQSQALTDKLINVVSLGVAVWIMWIAFQLYRAKGARIVRTAKKH